MRKAYKPRKPIIPLPKEPDFSHLKNQTFDEKHLYVLRHLAKGYSYEQIGDSVGITERAARDRMDILREQLEARCWATAYYRALVLGILTV